MSTEAATFTVSLKVGSDNIKLLIAVSDSTDAVFQRLSHVHPSCKNKKSEILEKLLNSLKVQLQNRTLNQNLLSSISQFLERNDQHVNEVQNHSKSHNAKQMAIYKGTPDKALQSVNQNKQMEKNSFKKRLSCLSQKQQNSSLPAKKGSVPVKQKLTPNKSSKINKNSTSVDNSKKCNPDIIKACEMIMKKTHNTDMKLMAKEFLKEKGYLKEEKQKVMSQNKKKHTIEDSPSNDKKIELNQLATQNIIASKDQQKGEVKVKGEASAMFGRDQTSLTILRQNNRFGKYKYLQSSLMNESLSKDYQSFSKHSESSILKQSCSRPKRYSYLD